jgi:para-nitrobenzyl esterase
LTARKSPEYLLANAENDGEKYAASLGVTSLQELRRLPADRLNGNAGGIVHPVIESYVFPVSPYQAFTSGRQNDVPLLLGSNAEEARSLHTTSSGFRKLLANCLGATTPR